MPLAEKQHLVNSVFGNVAARYDLMNDLMSGGMHRLWKRAFVGMVRPSRHRPFQHLDVAGGTGDIAFRVAAAGGAQTEVTVADISEDMLRVGRERALHTPGGERVRFVTGNAEDLPFPDNTFDCVLQQNVLHHVTGRSPRENHANMRRCVAEMYRVLEPGGKAVVIESTVGPPAMMMPWSRFVFALSSFGPRDDTSPEKYTW